MKVEREVCQEDGQEVVILGLRLGSGLNDTIYIYTIAWELRLSLLRRIHSLTFLGNLKLPSR